MMGSGDFPGGSKTELALVGAPGGKGGCIEAGVGREGKEGMPVLIHGGLLWVCNKCRG